MKKIILIQALLILFCLPTFSQSLSLTIHSKVVKADSVYEYVCSSTNPNIEYISVTNIAEETVNVMVKKVIVDTIPGTLNTFCWGINCFEPTTYVSPFPIAINTQATNTSFYGEYNPQGKVGSSKVMYVFYNNDDNNDSASVTIKYTLKNDGIGNYENVYANTSIRKIYPSPADERLSVSYKLTEDIKSTFIEIYDIRGEEVRTEKINASEGIIDLETSSLPEGMYSCTISNAKGIFVARKFLVVH